MIGLNMGIIKAMPVPLAPLKAAHRASRAQRGALFVEVKTLGEAAIRRTCWCARTS
jgi:hypothetical protein